MSDRVLPSGRSSSVLPPASGGSLWRSTEWSVTLMRKLDLYSLIQSSPSEANFFLSGFPVSLSQPAIW